MSLCINISRLKRLKTWRTCAKTWDWDGRLWTSGSANHQQEHSREDCTKPDTPLNFDVQLHSTKWWNCDSKMPSPACAWCLPWTLSQETLWLFDPGVAADQHLTAFAHCQRPTKLSHCFIGWPWQGLKVLQHAATKSTGLWIGFKRWFGLTNVKSNEPWIHLDPPSIAVLQHA